MRGCKGILEIWQSFYGPFTEKYFFTVILIVSNLDWFGCGPNLPPSPRGVFSPTPSRRTCTRRASVYQPWRKSLEAMARYYHLLPSWQTVKGTLNSLKRGGSKLPVVQDPPIMPNENLFSSLPALIACPCASRPIYRITVSFIRFPNATCVSLYAVEIRDLKKEKKKKIVVIERMIRNSVLSKLSYIEISFFSILSRINIFLANFWMAISKIYLREEKRSVTPLSNSI